MKRDHGLLNTGIQFCCCCLIHCSIHSLNLTSIYIVQKHKFKKKWLLTVIIKVRCGKILCKLKCSTNGPDLIKFLIFIIVSQNDTLTFILASYFLSVDIPSLLDNLINLGLSFF